MQYDTEQFEVVIVGFEPRPETPAQRLTRGFGIEPALAEQLVAQLPQAVQRGVPRVRAEYFRRALELLGARVEVFDAEGMRVERVDAAAAQQGATERAGAAELAPGAGEHGAMAATDPAPRSDAFWGVRDAPGAHAIAGLDPASIELRPPAAPTLREGEFLGIPARPGAKREHGLGPAPGSAPFASSDPLVPRVPSSVFDPAPFAIPAAARGAPLNPAPAQKPASVRPAPRSGPAREDAARFDLAKSVVGNGLWRSPSNRPPAASAEALTLDQAPQSPELRLLSSWEQPNVESIAEPPRRPAPAARSDPKNLQPPTRQLISVPAPKVPPNEQAFAVVSRALSSGPPEARAGGRVPSSPARGPSGQPRAARDPAAAPRDPLSGRARAPASAPISGPAQPISSRAQPVSGPAQPISGRAQPISGPAQRPPAVQGAAAVYPRTSDQPRVVLDTRSFFETFVEALMLPFRGAGVYWLAAIAVWSVAVGVFALLNRFALFIGGAAAFCAQTSVLALACDYYRMCMWAPLSGEDELERGPDFDPSVILNRYVKSGLNLSLFCIASQLPLIAYFVHWTGTQDSLADLITSPLTWLLALLPYAYWPMGVAIASVNNNFAAIWNVAAGFRAIGRAPLEYLLIVLAGVIALVGSWTLLVLAGSITGVTLALIGGTAGLPIAISHGVQGALMGHLARAKSELFE